jgi:hypothetical protein
MISKAGQLGLDLVWVGDGLVTDLVQGVRGVGDQLAQKDLLVRVEGINNKALDTSTRSIAHPSSIAHEHSKKSKPNPLKIPQNMMIFLLPPPYLESSTHFPVSQKRNLIITYHEKIGR